MSQRDIVATLLDDHGTTFAEEAGITLRDKPSPLYQLLVLATLSAARISAEIAVATARELFAEGWRTPQRMAEATWQQRVDGLGRGGYRRYDESTSTKLEEAARYVLEVHRGDLRRIRPESHDDLPRLKKALTDFPRLGPTGADIFCREVQGVWPEVAPFFDRRALAAAETQGLPTDPDRLADLAPRGRLPDLAAALVRAR